MTTLHGAAHRPFKFMTGMVLLPFAWALTRTVLETTTRVYPPETFFQGPAAWLMGGFAAWMIIFLLLPRPVRLYVLGHECTHAIWAFFMGGHFRGLEFHDDGGSVEVSNPNFWVMLAPYFVPFYTFLLLLVFGALSLVWDLAPWIDFWMGLFGLTWGFHVTFTLLALIHDQSDISENGALFSYTLIYIINLANILLWLVAVESPTLQEAHLSLLNHTPETYHSVLHHLGELFQANAGQ